MAPPILPTNDVMTSDGSKMIYQAITKAMQVATSVYTDAAQTYSAGFKQSFAADATHAGLAIGSVSADPSSLVVSDSWYRSDLFEISYYDGTSVRRVVELTLAQRLGAKDHVDTTTTISNVSSTSKAIGFSLSGMTASVVLTIASAQSTSQTINFPNITGSDTLQVLGLAQTRTAALTFPASGIILKGAGAGLGTFTYANSASSGTLTFPAVTDTVAVLGTAQTFSAKISFTQTATLAPINIGAQTASPSAPVEGDIWYVGPTGSIHYRDNTVSRTLIDLSLTQTLSGKTLLTPFIANVSSTSKAIGFSLSGMTSNVVLTLSSSQSTTQTLTIPNIAGADTLAVLGLAQTWSLTQTFSTKQIWAAIADPSAAAGQVWLSSTNTDVLKYSSASTIYNILSTKSATLTSTSAAPTGTTSATAVMMGLGGSATITPTVSTRVRVTVSCQMKNGTSGDGVTADLRWGTGAAPANADAVAGTLAGVSQTYTATANNDGTAFTVSAIITGLAIGTAIWFDVSLLAVTGGTASITGVTISANEV